MLHFERPIRFEEVDAAGIVFFAHFSAMAHDALARLLDQLRVPARRRSPSEDDIGPDGGYADLVVRRRIGLPAVHIEADFRAPLRFGDIARIKTRVLGLGNRSAVVGVEVERAADHSPAASIRLTVVTADLDRLASCEMPADVRALFEAHLDTNAASR